MSGPANILVVDGDPSTRILIRLVLKSAFPEAELVEVESAVPFAEAWASGPYRAVVYDPRTCEWAEGGRLIVAIKRQDPGALVLVLTTELDTELLAGLFRAGADDVLEKTSEVLVAIPGRIAAALTEPTERPDPSAHNDTELTPNVAREPDPTVDEAMSAEVQTDMGRPNRPSTPPEPGRGPDPMAMVHDLKEPLRTIHMLLDRVDRRHRDAMPQEARGLLQWAQRSSQQLSSDLDELYAELTGAVGPGDTVADANDAMNDALQHLSALAEDVEATVQTASLPTVRVPPSALRRILENLLANAMRHRGEKTPEIHVGARTLDNEAVFSVRDNGPGVPEGLRHRIFEPGVRGDDGGAGLGLYGARRLVERWGGQIWFDTEQGEGTTFYFTLPIATSRPARSSGSKN
jgi:DNA-binding NarL/FixJ family response regulator/anti-sigma regulatory factor (Ser/Thr protein kinase)